ncbi:65-kDa microtubule-associated protein 5 [Magnolia sinica]|uniref:65-kDa microtubule-associated protein 5 n=1 Tax=Magnolia sinica TaxID=86752 RepID=UPI0026589CAF|nr:65-kDa microtubule-associated protein 5 [Magnolia sinica]
MSPYQQMPLRSLSETTCGSLLQELQKIWDEIGENDNERDKMLLQLEQECLDVYRRKVQNASRYKAELHRALADAEAEAAQLVSALGERALSVWSEKVKGTLKEQVSTIKPVLDDLRRMKEERVKEFSDIQSQIVQICAEIAGDFQRSNAAAPQVDERDLTVKKLGELKLHLQELQREKRLRLQKVDGHVSSIHELSVVMFTDFYNVMSEVHPTLVDSANRQSKSISNDTLARLAGTAHSLKQEKQQRLQKLQDLGSTLMELWNLMDIPVDEQKRFDHVTRLISANVDEVSGKGLLAVDVIEQTESEIQKLNTLKASKMKELVFKKQQELEEIYRGVHMDVDSEAARQILLSLINSGNVDISELLTGMDDQIRKAKEQALSRKDILDKVEKWTFASEEENWLDDYERDQNRYSAGRGAHKNLKRAEKARILVSKIQSLVENLTAKVKAWEEENGMPFLYHKLRLLETLEEYTILRQDREEEKRRSREQKRLQGQHATAQEAMFGSRPTALRPLTMKKSSSNNVNTAGGTPTSRSVTTPSSRHGISGGKDQKDGSKVGAVIPVNYVALAKDDHASCNSSAIVFP